MATENKVNPETLKHGVIEDVKFSDRALTAAEIEKLYKDNCSITSDRGTSTLEVLAAVKRWIAAKDAEQRASEKAGPFLWPLIRKTQQALKDLEEAARKLELAK